MVTKASVNRNKLIKVAQRNAEQSMTGGGLVCAPPQGNQFCIRQL